MATHKQNHRWGAFFLAPTHWLLKHVVLLAALLAGCGQSDPSHEPIGATQAALEATDTASASAATGSGTSGTKTVWIVMRQKASLAQARALASWNARGQGVYQALRANAVQSQAPLRAELARLGVPHKAFWIVNALKVTADDATLAVLEQRADVERIVPDGVYSIPQPIAGSSTPRIQSTEWGLDSIRAPEAWEAFGALGDGVVVANIDTGVDYIHSALVRQYRGNQEDSGFDHNYNWYDPAGVCGDPANGPCDNVGHGTHTMGTMVGDDLEENQIGVAPLAQWIAVKGCEDYSCSYESLMSSGQWVLAPTDLSGANPRPDLRPNIVNNSWGGWGGDEFFREIVQAWVASGIFPAFSAGNDGPGCGTTGSPGDYPESHAAGAYDEFSEIAFFSARGPSAFDDVTKPDVAAPGVDVRSSIPGEGYDWYSGTSMASPHVAGTVALIWSAAPAIAGDVEATRLLLDQGAVDTADDSCGGTDQDNNVWGEGRLDAFAAVELAPRGPTGMLQGVVTAEDGAPIDGAAIRAVGDVSRATRSAADGSYRLTLPVGVYDVNVSAFGYLSQARSGVEIAEGVVTDLPFMLVVAPTYGVSGTAVDGEGNPMSGVEITILDTPLSPVLTDENGAYLIPSVPVGDYTMTADAGGCFETASLALAVVDGDVTQDITIRQKTDSYGYVCQAVDYEFMEATTPLGMWWGDGEAVSVTLPFPMMFYGQSHDTMTVTEDGYLTFSPFAYTWNNTSIPDAALPNGAVFAFWDDFFFYPGEGGVYTETLGTAPNRQFIVEWRDVMLYSSYETTVRFEIILHENGQILVQYHTADPEPDQKGRSATVGLESQDGTVGLEYSYNRAVLESGMAILYEVPHSGIVQGVIADGNDGLPIAGAEVAGMLPDGRERIAKTDKAGVYRLQLPAGDYVIEASADNYVEVTANVSVIEGETTTQDFVLDTARAVLAPSTIQVVMPMDTARTRQLVLGNTGSVDLDFEIREAGGSRQTTVRTASLPKNPSADANALTTRDLYTVTGQAAWSPSSPGDVISSFAPTGMGLAWGVGYLGNLWLSDAMNVQNVEFTTEGAGTGRSWSAAFGGAWAGDMAFDSTHGLVCQVNVGGDNGIYCWDPETGNVEDSITGALPWTGISQRGLAYRPDDDSFYVGGWNEGVIYHIEGLSSPNKGAVIESCMPADGAISGLAWNASMQVLWEATNSPTDSLYELSPTDCTVLSTLPHPSPMFNGGGLELDDAGELWMIGQAPNRVYLVESGVPAFSDVPWLSIDPAAGTVLPGAEIELTVTVNSAGLEPGLYLGSLFVLSNSGRQPRTRVPVSMVVSAYQQGVNAGGKLYTDGLGDPWSADKAYVAGGWGYVQRSKTKTTRQRIAGTDDPVLYQSQRIDPYAYRFDTVPNGVYEVDLRFAELANMDMGERLFDVIVEDTLVLPAHDIVYEVGRLAAERRVFFIEVADSRMDVRLVPRTGFSVPVVNALRVTHRPDR